MGGCITASTVPLLFYNFHAKAFVTKTVATQVLFKYLKTHTESYKKAEQKFKLFYLIILIFAFIINLLLKVLYVTYFSS